MKLSPFIRRIALVTLIAFLMHAIIPFFAFYQIPSTGHVAAAELDSVFGDKVFICTQSGFKWISVADLQQGKEQPKQHPQYQCALCYVSAHGLKDMTAALSPDANAPPLYQWTRTEFYPTISRLSHAPFLRALSRAPPQIS